MTAIMTDQSPPNVAKLVNDLMANNNASDEDSEAVLHQLKTYLASVNSSQMETIVREVNVTEICQQLNNAENNANTDVIAGVFDIVFETLSAQYILNNLHKDIVNGLDAKNDAFVELWLRTLDRSLTHELALNHTLNTEIDVHLVLIKVIRLFAKQQTSIAKHCRSIVLNIAKSNTLGDKFFEKDIHELLVVTKSVSDIVQMRVYDILVAIASTSHTNFYKVEGFGHLANLLTDFNVCSKTDPLLTLNILQILTDLGATTFGNDYLQSSEILKTIVRCLDTSDSDIFANLLIPGYVKIVATLAASDPKILAKYPSVLTKLKALLTDVDPSLVFCAIDGIAVMCYRNTGKEMVDKNNDISKVFMSTINNFLTNGSTEHKMRALNGLSNLLKLNESDYNSDLSTNFSYKWFQLFSPNDNKILVLLHIAKEPFIELRLAAMECIRVVTTFSWGQKELAATAGFLEYLLDRSTETTKHGKEAKYSIVKQLVGSPFISESFTKEAVIQLRAFYKEGPYYMGNDTAVSFEAV
ncbi:26S proteasome non-ATPase regulatory subunit 5-like [Oppia nitens]|uniref:26S proteasome non-ATPase regulatory subunit 5-like n=1 Tax=Oppia nitens TaxID=1686743 RepID=UPI0023DAD7FB|nr:26S proteasome non-ATPase regulatory subunit 5-like [Oppia nitens]